ncbi:MAG: beta-ketoacyl synthase N-terminal-like domain-containing protein [Planctomycetota bacterium]
MSHLPVAVTAAVAWSAAGRWVWPGAEPRVWPRVWPRVEPRVEPDVRPDFRPDVGPADDSERLAAWRWPERSPIQLSSELGVPVARLGREFSATGGLERPSVDRACNIAAGMADDLRPVLDRIVGRDPERFGCSVTVSKGGIGGWIDHARAPVGADGCWGIRAAEMDILAADAAGGFVAERLNLRGPRIAPVAACATGVATLAAGARMLATDHLAGVVCGGAESSLHPAVVQSMLRMGILDRAPMRPFDRRRAGFNLGEGGALLLLEAGLRPDRRANANSDPRPLAWLVSAAVLADAHHLTELHPQRGTLTRLIRRLFKEARANGSAGDPPCESLYVNAHATGTVLNDRWESAQLIDAFGPAGWARREGWIAPSAPVVVSGTKSLTGHLLGAGGAVEAALCVAVLNGAPPPATLHLSAPDGIWPEAVDPHEPLELLTDPLLADQAPARRAEWPRFAAALSLNFGFGGHVGGLLFERAEDGR